jgi:hypothetical protein
VNKKKNMIEVEAEILRGSCMPVYFVGETIECLVRFKCLPSSSNISVNSSSSSTSISSKQRMASSASNSDVAGIGGGGGASTVGLSTTSSQSTITSNISPSIAAAAAKVKYVDLAETASICSANFDEKKLNEINQSMFSLLATYPSTSSMSNTSSSIPSTPTENSTFPGIILLAI